MKKFIVLIIILFVCSFAYSENLEIPAKSFPSTISGEKTFPDGVIVGGDSSRVTFSPNAEYIDSPSGGDGLLVHQGVGDNATDIVFNLQNMDASLLVIPQIYSVSSGTIEFMDRLKATTPTITNPFTSSGMGIVHKVSGDNATISGGTLAGIKSTNILGGSGWLPGTKLYGGYFVNATTLVGLGGLGNGGDSANCTSYGFFTQGAKGQAPSDGTAVFTVNDIYGAQIQATHNYVTVAGDSKALYLKSSGTNNTTIAGDETMLHIDEPETGNTKHQVVLEGEGVGAGIWFGTTGGCRLYQMPTGTCGAGASVIDVGTSTKDLCAICP